jgi:hypothetical protein
VRDEIKAFVSEMPGNLVIFISIELKNKIYLWIFLKIYTEKEKEVARAGIEPAKQGFSGPFIVKL